MSDGGMTLQALGGVNSPCDWYRARGQPLTTGGQEHTHTHIYIKFHCEAYTSFLKNNTIKIELMESFAHLTDIIYVNLGRPNKSLFFPELRLFIFYHDAK